MPPPGTVPAWDAFKEVDCDRQMGHCLKSQPCGQRQDVPWEPLGVSGVILTQCLNLEIILPLKGSFRLPPDVPQTSSSLLVSWDGAGVLWL